MLTRCPHCQTVFRASQEQLARYHGQVRCGACYHPFNAHAHLVKEDEDIFLFAWQEDEPSSPLPPATAMPLPEPLSVETTPIKNLLPEAPAPESPSPQARQETQRPESTQAKTPHDKAAPPEAPASSPAGESIPPKEDEPSSVTPRLDPIDEHLSFQLNEDKSSSPDKKRAAKPQTAEEIRQHGLNVGMVAARHRKEFSDFSSWSAPPLDSEPPAYSLWPFTLAAIFFAFILAVQTVLHFRSEINRTSPAFASLFHTLGLEIPYPREPELLSIDASELQTLDEPDRLRLFLTLRNKARYSLAWPHLELSLTDAYNSVQVRKVFAPDEYLTRTQASGSFAPGDAMIQLDLGARAIAPAGYNLYLFYP